MDAPCSSQHGCYLRAFREFTFQGIHSWVLFSVGRERGLVRVLGRGLWVGRAGGGVESFLSSKSRATKSSVHSSGISFLAWGLHGAGCISWKGK